MLAAVDQIEAAFEDKKKCGAVFIDLSSAYDTVWHRGLILKLHHALQDKQMAQVITEIISNRCFRVLSDGRSSRTRNLKNGVPQGSVLAPALFNLYTADMPPTSSSKYAYADDLAIISTSNSFEEAEHILTKDIQTLQAYYHQWRLKLNAQKTICSVFHLNNKEANRQLRVKLCGALLPFSPTPTYLGVKLDRSLTFRHHLQNVAGKASARVSLLRRLCGLDWGADFTTLRSSTLALVHAPAEYCASVWGQSCHTKRVDAQLNSALRTITGCLRPTPTHQLPVLAGIPPHHLRREAATRQAALKAATAELHPLHTRVQAALPRQRLRSRKPFIRLAQTFINENQGASRRVWLSNKWKEQQPAGRLTDMLPLTTHPPGCDLPRKEWCRLNRLRTGVGRFKACLHLWNLSDTDRCDCGEVQTADHLVDHCTTHQCSRQIFICTCRI